MNRKAQQGISSVIRQIKAVLRVGAEAAHKAGLVGFDDLLWLREVRTAQNNPHRAACIPDSVLATLIQRGLAERRFSSLRLTKRGVLALQNWI
jgi:hypothetical protein